MNLLLTRMKITCCVYIGTQNGTYKRFIKNILWFAENWHKLLEFSPT